MNIQHHLNDPGIAGTSLAGGLTLMGFIANSIPVLQAVSLMLGIAVAIITFIFYWRKLRKGE